MRKQLLNFFILTSLLVSCESQPEKIPYQKENENTVEKPVVEKLYVPNLVLIDDNHKLKDSTTFYELINYIIENAERNGEETHELTDGSISLKVYNMVYETPDTEISLNRKLDLLSLMFFYHYHAANEYSAKISAEIFKGNKKVTLRPVLLVPVLNATYWPESVLAAIIRQETLQLPRSYVPTMKKTLLEINELLSWRKANHQNFNGPINYIFDKDFKRRYSKHSYNL